MYEGERKWNKLDLSRRWNIDSRGELVPPDSVEKRRAGTAILI